MARNKGPEGHTVLCTHYWTWQIMLFSRFKTCCIMSCISIRQYTWRFASNVVQLFAGFGEERHFESLPPVPRSPSCSKFKYYWIQSDRCPYNTTWKKQLSETSPIDLRSAMRRHASSSSPNYPLMIYGMTVATWGIYSFIVGGACGCTYPPNGGRSCQLTCELTYRPFCTAWSGNFSKGEKSGRHVCEFMFYSILGFEQLMSLFHELHFTFSRIRDVMSWWAAWTTCCCKLWISLIAWASHLDI